jgi:hypothetical protein
MFRSGSAVLLQAQPLSSIRPADVTSIVWRRHGSRRANSSNRIEDARHIANLHKSLELHWDDTYGCFVAAPNKHFATLMVFVTEPS